MTKKLNIWGRTFDLRIIYDVYDNEEVLDIQKEALEYFVAESGRLFASYKDIEKYCLKAEGDRIGKSIDNIFKYVKPEAIYIKRSEKKHIVALLCNYRFDEEHGLALIYENEELKSIGSQDCI